MRMANKCHSYQKGKQNLPGSSGGQHRALARHQLLKGMLKLKDPPGVLQQVWMVMLLLGIY